MSVIDTMNAYIRRIRNARKKQYACDYRDWLVSGRFGPEPERFVLRLSYRRSIPFPQMVGRCPEETGEADPTMIFSVQHYLEDHFHQRNLRDVDQYAVKLANLYARKRKGQDASNFLKAMRRVQTVFYKNNQTIEREPTEKDLLRRLDSKFQKKTSDPNPNAVNSR